MVETRYRSLDTHTEIEKSGTDDNDKSLRTKPRGIWDIVTFERVLWLVGAFTVGYLSEFVSTLKHNELVDRFWLSVALLLFGVVSTIFSFLVIYCSQLKGISSDDWNIHYPYAIPVATASIILFHLSLCMAVWPVYRYLTPVLLFIFFMASVCLVSMLDIFLLAYRKIF